MLTASPSDTGRSCHACTCTRIALELHAESDMSHKDSGNTPLCDAVLLLLCCPAKQPATEDGVSYPMLQREPAKSVCMRGTRQDDCLTGAWHVAGGDAGL